MFSDYIQSGDLNKTCEFLNTANLIKGEKGFKFQDILWLLKDKKVFGRITEILRNRYIYNNDVWSYGFKHNDMGVIKEFMLKNKVSAGSKKLQFSYNELNSSGETSNFRHLDYFPLVNSRAHQLSNDKNQGILNREFRSTYNKFLVSLSEKETLSTEDLLNWSLYYLLQEKVKEAIEMYTRIDQETIPEGGSMRIQYDYLGAYLDFYNDNEDTNYQSARDIVKKYKEYPVLYWKHLFAEVHQQLQEFDGVQDEVMEIDQHDEEKDKANLKTSKNLAPGLEARVDRKQIILDYMNIESVEVKYYIIDPELMFSKSPFLSQNTDSFSFIKPQHVDTIFLSDDKNSHEFDINKEYSSQNLAIEILGGGKQIFLSYFSSELKVILNESFGELKVTDQVQKPLSKVYIKVYSRNKDGQAKFFKDGYTDIRGRFEYAQSSSGKLGNVEKFSIFIMSDDLGSLTKECNPPSNVKKDFELLRR